MAGLAALAVVAAIGLLLLPWRAGALLWIGGVALIWAASVYAGLVEERHSGHLVLLALTLLWVRPERPTARRATEWKSAASWPHRPLRAVASLALAVTLLWHVAMTAGVGGTGVLGTTSNGERAVALIAASRSATDAPPVILTGQVYDAAAVVALLDRAVFDTDCRCTTRYRADSTVRAARPPPSRIESDWCALVASGHDVIGLFPDGRHRPDARHEILGTLARSTRFPEPVPLYRLRNPALACPPDDGPVIDVPSKPGSDHDRG